MTIAQHAETANRVRRIFLIRFPKLSFGEKALNAIGDMLRFIGYH